jgi:hypothetical protein
MGAKFWTSAGVHSVAHSVGLENLHAVMASALMALEAGVPMLTVERWLIAELVER